MSLRLLNCAQDEKKHWEWLQAKIKIDYEMNRLKSRIQAPLRKAI